MKDSLGRYFETGYGEKLGLVWRNRKKILPNYQRLPLLTVLSLIYFMHKGIILYQEYQSVCPFVRIGSPAPFSRKRVYPPPPPGTNGEGGNTHLWARGGGANSDNWRKSAWHYEYSVQDTYIAYCTENENVVFFSTKNAAKNYADMLTFQEKCKTFHM
jgi:hypothetical protein